MLVPCFMSWNKRSLKCSICTKSCGVMVWAGISYRQRTQLHFTNCNWNAQRYCEEILRPIVVPFIRRHHLRFQLDNEQPHFAIICTQFLEVENVPVLPWPAYSPDMSPPIECVWDALDWGVWQRFPDPVNIQQFHTAVEEESTTNSLIHSMRRKYYCPVGARNTSILLHPQ